MAVLNYDFESVKRAVSSGSAIDNSMSSIQDKLVALRKELNKLEGNFHGTGYKSTLYKNYDELYKELGNTYSGFWNTLKNAKDSLEYLYSSAVNDKRLWDEEQERLRREREERERREKEEKERKEKEEEEKRKKEQEN